MHSDVLQLEKEVYNELSSQPTSYIREWGTVSSPTHTHLAISFYNTHIPSEKEIILQFELKGAESQAVLHDGWKRKTQFQTFLNHSLPPCLTSHGWVEDINICVNRGLIEIKLAFWDSCLYLKDCSPSFLCFNSEIADFIYLKVAPFIHIRQN